MFEPEERIKIQEINPEPYKNIYSLDLIQFETIIPQDGSQLIKSQDLSLNRNLVSVIGGKGEGKTAILDLIAHCFEDRKSPEDKNSFIYRISIKKDIETEIRIGFIQNEKEMFSKKIKETVFHQHSRIEYEPQGKIEEFTTDESKLDKEIKKIVFNSEGVKDESLFDEFNNLQRDIDKRKSLIKNLNDNICTLVFETRAEITDDLKEKLDLKKGELENNKRKM